jgi:tRNA G18 (ribose-2'-O)-methylase SpoU
VKFRKTPNQELDRKSIEEFKDSKKIPVVVLLDNIRSMHNVGAAFRTADAFLIEKIYLTGITARPPHRDIHKTALGATESVVWEFQESTVKTIKKLQADGYTIISVEQAEPNVSLEDFTPDTRKKYCLIFGNEVNGVEEEAVQASDFCLEIPQSGTKHSLNVSVSIGVVLWKFYSQLTL